ncbi:MAG: hypothetical protein QOG05_4523 [Streptosporangiaceae bacterium]|jgi:hypothetical protein|nr:hypothetical protein [Streptosporangiaceae bacterium]
MRRSSVARPAHLQQTPGGGPADREDAAPDLPTRLSQFGAGSEHLDAIDSAVMAEEPSLSNRRDDIVAMIEQVV